MRSITRRNDIDLLRVAAFAILIFYHIGMVYVADWGYHVKSQYQSDFLAYLMLMVNPWRLPLLFVISGFATNQMLKKYSVEEFIRQRSFLLLLPLLFGVLVVVPPQLYVEMTQNDDFEGGFWLFMQEFYNPNSMVFEQYQAGILPHIDVNHLWYLRELWLFSMFLVLLTPVINQPQLHHFLSRCCHAFNGWGVLVVPSLVICLVKLLVYEQEAELAKNSVYFVFFIFGFWLSQRKGVWGLLWRRRLSFTVVGLVCNVLIIVGYDQYPWSGDSESFWQSTWLLVSSCASWCWVIAILGWGRCLYRQHQKRVGQQSASRQLEYLNQAVYPYYIIHQTIIVVGAYYLSSWQLGAVIEPVLLIILTVAGCFIFYEIVRRIHLLRPMFGLRLVPRSDSSYFGEPRLMTKALTLLSYGCLMPFAAIIMF